MFCPRADEPDKPGTGASPTLDSPKALTIPRFSTRPDVGVFFSEGFTMTTKLDKVLYTAKAHTTGGRDGHSKTDDGRLEVNLSSPGTAGTGTNPEQLFAAGYSACFIGAIKAVAGMQKITLPDGLAIDASVDLGKIPAGYGIAARLDVTLPGMDRTAAQALIDAAHQVCPYSNATRGNIDVTITLK
jgi:Ohr subfamily peroxiredoxin